MTEGEVVIRIPLEEWEDESFDLFVAARVLEGLERWLKPEAFEGPAGQMMIEGAARLSEYVGKLRGWPKYRETATEEES